MLPRGELEVLLDHAIELCTRGIDTQSEPCQRFFREGLTIRNNRELKSISTCQRRIPYVLALWSIGRYGRVGRYLITSRYLR